MRVSHAAGQRKIPPPPNDDQPPWLARRATATDRAPTGTHAARSPPPLSPRPRRAQQPSLRHLASSHCHLAAMRSLLMPLQLALAAAFAVAAASSPAQPQQGAGDGAVPSCAPKLAPCGPYLNSTDTPPAACCGPLREAAANETACLCAILLNKAALQAFGVAPKQGLLLAKNCGVTTDASACSNSAATGAGTGAATPGGTAASSASTGNSASTVTKPTTSGGAATHRLSLIGASAMVGFSFMWWAIMA
ncbi:hypothetical protein ACP70R_043658 [Stipagrostis hirtigluma subsp. patula]